MSSKEMVEELEELTGRLEKSTSDEKKAFENFNLAETQVTESTIEDDAAAAAAAADETSALQAVISELATTASERNAYELRLKGWSLIISFLEQETREIKRDNVDLQQRLTASRAREQQLCRAMVDVLGQLRADLLVSPHIAFLGITLMIAQLRGIVGRGAGAGGLGGERSEKSEQDEQGRVRMRLRLKRMSVGDALYWGLLLGETAML